MHSRDMSPAQYQLSVQSGNNNMMSASQDEFRQNFSDFFFIQKPRYLSGAGMAAATQHPFHPNAMWNYKYDTPYDAHPVTKPTETNDWNAVSTYHSLPNTHHFASHSESDNVNSYFADNTPPTVEIATGTNDRPDWFSANIRAEDIVDPKIASYQAFSPPIASTTSSWIQNTAEEFTPLCNQLYGDIYPIPPPQPNVQQTPAVSKPPQSSGRSALEPAKKWQDSNGVWWLTVTYQKRGFSNELDINCDMSGYETAVYDKSFQQRNCIYPNAMVHPSEYHGHRQNYEMDCNLMAWRSVSLNPVLDSQRGLIQRAVDSYRNSTGDPSTQSRRTSRLAKRQAKAEQQALAAAGRRRKRKSQVN